MKRAVYEIIDKDERTTINLRRITHVSMEVMVEGDPPVLKINFASDSYLVFGGVGAIHHYDAIVRAMRKLDE